MFNAIVLWSYVLICVFLFYLVLMSLCSVCFYLSVCVCVCVCVCWLLPFDWRNKDMYYEHVYLPTTMTLNLSWPCLHTATSRSIRCSTSLFFHSSASQSDVKLVTTAPRTKIVCTRQSYGSAGVKPRKNTFLFAVTRRGCYSSAFFALSSGD